jgi:hypothetical protein
MGVRPSCALGGGAGTRGPRRLGYGTRTVVGAMVRLAQYSQGTKRVLAGYSWARALNDLRGAVERAVRGTRNGDSQSTSTRGGTANDTEYPTALRHCGGCCQRTHGHVRRGDAHGSATVRAGARRGAYGHQRSGARTQAHGAASRAWRAHRKVSLLSADSASGIVPSSEFNSKDLRRAWFVPLCSERPMHRSVPRTPTGTSRGGRMGLRPRGYWTRVLEGVLHACPLRARATKCAPAVPQCAHTFHRGTANHTEYPTALRHCRRLLPAYSRPRAARGRARQGDGACGRAQGCLRTPRGRHGSGAAAARQRRCARTQAQGAASRAGRAHRPVSSLSADSAAGIVPSSEFELKDLRFAWFVLLCREMLMHRSVPRTHTGTSRGGRMGLRPRGYWTRVLEGCAARVPSSCPGDQMCSSRAAVRTLLP